MQFSDMLPYIIQFDQLTAFAVAECVLKKQQTTDLSKTQHTLQFIDFVCTSAMGSSGPPSMWPVRGIFWQFQLGLSNSQTGFFVPSIEVDSNLDIIDFGYKCRPVYQQ